MKTSIHAYYIAFYLCCGSIVSRALIHLAHGVEVAGGVNMADGLSHAEMARIADAIYVVEGGKKTRYPYGIKSVPVSGAHEARAVCLRTIQNAHTDWLIDGQPGDYIRYLARRYCPPQADPVGHRNWLRNIRARL